MNISNSLSRFGLVFLAALACAALLVANASANDQQPTPSSTAVDGNFAFSAVSEQNPVSPATRRFRIERIDLKSHTKATIFSDDKVLLSLAAGFGRVVLTIRDGSINTTGPIPFVSTTHVTSFDPTGADTREVVRADYATTNLNGDPCGSLLTLAIPTSNSDVAFTGQTASSAAGPAACQPGQSPQLFVAANDVAPWNGSLLLAEPQGPYSLSDFAFSNGVARMITKRTDTETIRFSATGGETKSFSLPPHHAIRSVSLGPDGRYAVVSTTTKAHRSVHHVELFPTFGSQVGAKSIGIRNRHNQTARIMFCGRNRIVELTGGGRRIILRNSAGRFVRDLWVAKRKQQSSGFSCDASNLSFIAWTTNHHTHAQLRFASLGTKKSSFGLTP
jgi:hypothetical protein